MGTLTEIALFAGAGGGVWASRELGHRVVCYVEREPYCVQVLTARIDDGSFPDAPIWDDVFTFDGHPWRGRVDLISAGFPCQPFSVAGAQLGADDPRNGWPATARIIREVRPRFVFLENVPGLASNGYLGTVLGDLAACGYDAEWSCLSAQQVGAPHKRDRIWILAAHSERGILRNEPRRGGRTSGQGEAELADDGEQGALANSQVPRQSCGIGPERDGAKFARPRGIYTVEGTDTDADSGRRQEVRRQEQSRQQLPQRNQPDGLRQPWETEPDVGRVADGVANRSKRLKALGNGQVPQCAVAAFRGLMRRHEVKR